MKRLVFDVPSIKQNIQLIQDKVGSSEIYGVLNNDGYGYGLSELAQLLWESGVTRFAVNELADAETLRGLFPDSEILMLCPTAAPAELERLLDADIVCTVSSSEDALALNAAAGSRSDRAFAHLLIDTGTGFSGFLPEEQEKILAAFCQLSNVEITGVYTHLYSAGDDINDQLDRFSSVLDYLRREGLEPGLCHAAGSWALMSQGHTMLNAVRVGSAFLGLTGQGKRHLRKVKHSCRGEAGISSLTWLPKGSTVGMDRLVTMTKPTRVAVIPVGYLHGFGAQRPRRSGLLAQLGDHARKNPAVYVNGQSVRIIGRIQASETALDVTDVPCTLNDIVSFQINPSFARGMERVYRKGER